MCAVLFLEAVQAKHTPKDFTLAFQITASCSEDTFFQCIST